VPTETAAEDDWPETAALGGSGADGGVQPPSASAVSTMARPAVAAPSVPSQSAPSQSAPPQSSSTPSAADRAAARAVRGKGSSGKGSSGTRSGGDDAWAGATGEEPPYDPEFDPPVPGSASHLGFDPGDEPVDDDAQGSADRPTSEQQALDLLRDALGAEKIG
jgi:DNA polymerase-3 subunit gamma/tau